MRGEQRLSGLKRVALGVNIVRRVTPIFRTTHELFIERINPRRIPLIVDTYMRGDKRLNRSLWRAAHNIEHNSVRKKDPTRTTDEQLGTRRGQMDKTRDRRREQATARESRMPKHKLETILEINNNVTLSHF